MTDPWVIKIIGGVDGMERYPEMMAAIGSYVQRYDPEMAPLGEQWLWVTDDLDEAISFDDPADLHRYWTQSIGTRPWDGKPDRPLTAYHIETARRSTFKGGLA